MAFAFEKLIIYQKAVDFADQICLRTEHFPRGYGFLIDQANRAALSNAATIAEGNGRFTVRDRKYFFRNACRCLNGRVVAIFHLPADQLGTPDCRK
jgi:hypothetical protein